MRGCRSGLPVSMEMIYQNDRRFSSAKGKNHRGKGKPVVSGKVFAMRQAVEISLNLGTPTIQSIHGIYKLFPSPPLGGVWTVGAGLKPAPTGRTHGSTPHPVSSPRR